MQTVNVIMLLLGCTHNAHHCEPTELDHPYYASIEQCEGDIPAQEHFAENFPITVVKCLEVDKLAANEAVKIQWYFNNNGVLIASAGSAQGNDPLVSSDIQVASTNTGPQQ